MKCMTPPNYSEILFSKVYLWMLIVLPYRSVFKFKKNLGKDTSTLFLVWFQVTIYNIRLIDKFIN